MKTQKRYPQEMKERAVRMVFDHTPEGGARPPTEKMIAYIDTNRDRFGIEPICRQLPIASSTYYDAKSRPPSARAIRDEELKAEIGRVHAENFGVYVSCSNSAWRA